MRRWTDGDFARLFRDHPATGTTPTTAEFAALARELDRTLDAVRSQWHEAHSLVLGSRDHASRPLREYLATRGWLSGGIESIGERSSR